MAYALSNSTIAQSFTGAPYDVAAKWKFACHQLSFYNRTVNEINRLDYRDLDDIGIARNNIAAIPRDAAAKAV